MNRKTIFSVACGLPVVLYILTASRTLPWGDGAEFFVAVRNLGIPHPTGYPLFILLGRVLYLLSSSPFMLNLLPGLITICAGFFLYLIILQITKSPVISLALVLFFATGREVWQQSVVAEVYTLNVCLFTCLLYLILNAQKNTRCVIPAFFIAGLALTNHLTSIFYIVPCCIYLIVQRPRNIRFLPVALIPLFLYLYFPIRSHADPVPDLFDPETAGRLLAYVSGRSFLYRAFSLTRPSFVSDILLFLKSWWFSCFILLPLGFYGLFKCREKRSRILLLGISALVLVYTFLYHIPDKQGYYLPFYAIWFIFIGIAIVKILPKKFYPLLFILPIVSTAINYQACDLSRETSLDDLSTAMVSTLPDTCIFISDDYFVYYDVLNRVQVSSKQVIPVVQFYLRMDWYIEQISEHYPDLIIPASIKRLISDCGKALMNSPRSQHGEINKLTCLSVQHEIVRANIDIQPVFYFMYDDAHWPSRSHDLYLQYHGLYYQYQKDSVPSLIFDLNIPPADDYRVDKLIHPGRIFVAKKFAAAYNRRGIYRSLHADMHGAIDDMYSALEYYPEYYQVHANLGLTFLSINDTTRALAEWENYLKRSPPGPQRDRIQTWYNSFR